MQIPPVHTTSAALGSTAPAGQGAAESAKEFEAMFLGQMVDEMLSTVKMGNFGGGHAEATWRSFLSDAIGRSIAEQNTTGIAKGIEAAIQSYQSGQDR